MQSPCHEHLITIPLFTESDTIACAEILAQYVTQSDTILLNGALGMGKTVFARGMIQKLRNDPSQSVTSPTYTLVNEYERTSSSIAIRHYDLYRLAHPEDIYELGWEDNPQFLCLVEWPEKGQHLDDWACWQLTFAQTPTGREVRIIPPHGLSDAVYHEVSAKFKTLIGGTANETSSHV